MTGMSQIVVLGMRESGAPALTRLIASMGAQADRHRGLEGDRPERPQSAWEHPGVRDLNEGILAALGKSWLDCGDLALDRLPAANLRQFRNAAAAIVTSLETGTPCAIHDPHMPLLLDLWKPLLPRAVYVLVHRSPRIVAQSISLRYGLPLEFCLALWERYNLAALAGSSGSRRTIIAYEQMLRDPLRTAGKLHAELKALGIGGLEVPAPRSFHASTDAGLEDVRLTPEQRALAHALEDGSALNKHAFKASTTAVGGVGQGQAPPQAAEQHPHTALLKVKLLRQREKVQALRTEIEQLRQATESQPATEAPGRSKGVFIIGCPRSGTSVFAWALAQHPNFWTSAESDYLLRLFGQGHLHTVYTEALKRADVGWLNKHKVGFTEFVEKLGLGAEALFASRAGNARWVDATPGYTLMIEELLKLFPAARFLHILRDGRSVVNSMISSDFDIDWATDFAAACRTWAHYAMLGHKAVQAHPERVLEVRHHELAARPKSELARVFAFLGEQPCDRSVNLISKGRINSSYGNVRPGDIKLAKDPATVPQRPWEQWTPAQHRIFSRIAGEAMAILDY